MTKLEVSKARRAAKLMATHYPEHEIPVWLNQALNQIEELEIMQKRYRELLSSVKSFVAVNALTRPKPAYFDELARVSSGENK